MVVCEAGGKVGQRVAVGEHLGTVRYVGPLPSAKGTWLGVEWDDPNRGKHNGTYNDHKYFETRHPNSGSFIHIEKADFGRSFVSAVKERYGSNQPTLTAEELQDLQRAMNAPHVELVGFDKVNEKQSCFSDLEVIGLHNNQVCCAGDDLAAMSLRALEVDLSLNLLTSWSQVAEITTGIPSIHSLNLSSNKLDLPENPEDLRDAFKNLSHLVIGHMGYSWQQILTCLKMWPDIQELQVPFNNITSILLPKNTLTNLTHLDLEGNKISEWQEINKLGELEKLESLNLCDLGLTNIRLPPSQILFKNLQTLMLSDNKIFKWQQVSQLNKLPRLKELKFSNNPILDDLSVINLRYNIIPRIGSLEVLNRLKITEEERRGAELEYLRKYEKEWLGSQKDEDTISMFLAKHPRFPLLVKLYGLTEEKPFEFVNSNFITLKFCSLGKTITKAVPKSMTLLYVITLVRKLFNCESKTPILGYRCSKYPKIKGYMTNLSQTLDFYSLENGDEIIVKW